MSSILRHAGLLVCVASLLSTSLVFAETPQTPQRVRGRSAEVRDLIQQLTTHSATGRSLVERLNNSDRMIYVSFQRFATRTLRGRTGLPRGDGPAPSVIVEISQSQPYGEQLVALAHELQHAVEIASAPEIVDVRTLAAYYERVGTCTGHGSRLVTFETAQARDVSSRVHHELHDAR